MWEEEVAWKWGYSHGQPVKVMNMCYALKDPHACLSCEKDLGMGFANMLMLYFHKYAKSLSKFLVFLFGCLYDQQDSIIAQKKNS